MDIGEPVRRTTVVPKVRPVDPEKAPEREPTPEKQPEPAPEKSPEKEPA